MGLLEQTIGTLRFKSPIILGAGPLSDRPDLILAAAENGAGAVSIKQTAYRPARGVRKMTAERGNHLFTPSDRRLDIHKAATLLRQVKGHTDIPLFVSMLGDGADTATWAELGIQLQDAGADALELNFACPNLPDARAPDDSPLKLGAAISKDPDMAGAIIEAVAKAVSIPVWAKFSGEGVDYVQVAQKAADGGVDGLVLFCSPRGAFPINIYAGGRPAVAELEKCSFGGLNGPAIRRQSLRVVAEVAAARPGIPIMGGGGVSRFEHVVENIMYGASLCFVFTEVMLNGFEAIGRLNQGLEGFMEQQGYAGIEAMRGLALGHVVGNKDLEPVIGPPAKVDAEKCTGCGSCARIAFCRAITMQDKRPQVDAALCECCGLCASVCPRKAIGF